MAVNPVHLCLESKSCYLKNAFIFIATNNRTDRTNILMASFFFLNNIGISSR